MKPNFFLVGGPRAGTTSLAAYLRDHPGVFLSRPKEPFFFSTDFPRLATGEPTLAAYLSLFRGAGPGHAAVGEATSLYLCSSEEIPAIRGRAAWRRTWSTDAHLDRYLALVEEVA